VITHWNGAAWKNVPGPAGDGFLSGVAATSARNAWAGGTSYNPAKPPEFKTLILHWDGTRWK
jgi:hypothetical protein